jgi:hypothetical protein
MTLVLTEEQRKRLGRMIWQHVDGVAKNVQPLISAINAEPLTGIRVVAVDEWDKAMLKLHALQVLVHELEGKATSAAGDAIAPVARRLQAILAASNGDLSLQPSTEE